MDVCAGGGGVGNILLFDLALFVTSHKLQLLDNNSVTVAA
jgi:hypothetical protein